MNRKLTKRERLSYGFGSLGASTVYGITSTYLMLFYTDYVGISLFAVGVLFLVARVWDAVTDIIMGIIVDNTNTKWGRFRPYIFFAPFFIALITILTFSSPNFTPMGKVVWAYVTYIAWGIAFTARDIPFWSLSAALTQDTAERNNIVMITRTVAMVGIISINVITLPLINILGNGNDMLGWQIVAGLYGLMCIVFSLITFFNVKEEFREKRKEKSGYKETINLIKENGPLKTLLGFMLISETVMTIKNIFPAYYLKNNFNAIELIPVFMGLYAITTVIGALITPYVSKKLGKKKTVMYSSIITSLISICIFYTGYSNIYILFAWIVPMGIVDGIAEIGRNSMLIDTVEYGQWKTGVRREGLIFSTNIFKTKLASAIGGALGAFLLGVVGYITVPNAVQSEATIKGIHYIFTIVPGIFSLFALIPLSKYSLSEKQYEEILEDLKNK